MVVYKIDIVNYLLMCDNSDIVNVHVTVLCINDFIFKFLTIYRN